MLITVSQTTKSMITNYSNGDVAELIQSREILSANHVCGEMKGAECYAHLVKSLNRLSIELEKFKLELLRNG